MLMLMLVVLLLGQLLVGIGLLAGGSAAGAALEPAGEVALERVKKILIER